MYKVIKGNNVIDAIKTLRYVKRNKQNGFILLCTEETAQGILSYDGSTIYQLFDREKMSEEYDAVTLERITEDEFYRLRKLIDGVESDDTSDADGDLVENDVAKEPMSVAEMREKIIKLEEQFSAFKTLLENLGITN